MKIAQPRIDQNTTGVEACDLQAGDVITAACGKRLKITCVANISGRTHVSFHNATATKFHQTDRLDIVRYIYA